MDSGFCYLYNFIFFTFLSYPAFLPMFQSHCVLGCSSGIPTTSCLRTPALPTTSALNSPSKYQSGFFLNPFRSLFKYHLPRSISPGHLNVLVALISLYPLILFILFFSLELKSQPDIIYQTVFYLLIPIKYKLNEGSNFVF